MTESGTYLAYIFSSFVGIGLAASTGFRVFLPIFLLSIASFFGVVPIDEHWRWMASLPTLITTGIACVLEVIAYYIPIVDNFFDTLAVPLASVAGTLLFASQFTEIGSFAQWSLAIIAGGGTASLIGGGLAGIRAASTSTTGGLGNSVVASIENLGALILPIISFIIPVIAVIIVGIILILLFVFGRKVISKFKPKKELI